MRSSGILLHVTSLPTPGGIGTLGETAYRFVDFLKKSGMSIWQVLPVGPTGYGESPYQSGSTFAGNPLMIDIVDLEEKGLLEKGAFEPLPDSDKVDYACVSAQKDALLRQSFAYAYEKVKDQVEAYTASQEWLSDYALYAALKKKFDLRSWMEWPDDARLRKDEAMAAYKEELKDEIAYQCYVQYLFDLQWNALKDYAHANGVKLFGDMPIYVAEDSADAWGHPENFQFNEDRRPTGVAGVPPDYFSQDGQLWGNPLYNWDAMKEEGYSWWLKRLSAMGERFDYVRVDHFIGFANYYRVPAGAPNARTGEWIIGPGRDFFKKVKKELPHVHIIAEDLGAVNDRVRSLLKFCEYPGMKVLQFAMGGGRNPHAPGQHKENAIVYTGTHDNDTTLGWYKAASEEEQKKARRLSKSKGEGDIVQGMIRLAMSSVCDTAIVPMQDVLGLDTDARMNTPGVVGGNWQWRMTALPNQKVARELKALVKEYNREVKKK
ncbi:MAG: 4-alpha-glucanotransferase [Clostridiales bacterium]|nr:4-alpha-glucanotransferase [Clostridiales bacterium]